MPMFINIIEIRRTQSFYRLEIIESPLFPQHNFEMMMDPPCQLLTSRHKSFEKSSADLRPVMEEIAVGVSELR